MPYISAARIKDNTNGVLVSLFSQFSETVWSKLRSSQGPRRLPFFTMYEHLKSKWSDETFSPGYSFEDAFRNLRRIIYTGLTSENAKNKFKAISADLLLLLRRVDNEHVSRANYVDIAVLYGNLIELVAAEKDVFLKGMERGIGSWKFFRSVTDQEESLLRLKRDDPSAYETIVQQKEILQEEERKIQSKIKSDGYEPVRTKRFGQLFWSATTETGDKIIYYRDKNTGMVTSQDNESFTSYLKEKQQAEKKSLRIFPTDLNEIRRYSESDVTEKSQGQTPLYVAITDDKAKQHGITRIYPTIEINGERVVSEGRFKGFVVDDLVNDAGRQIEGVAFNFDPDTQLTTKIEIKSQDGNPNVRVNREPYVTLDQNGKLYIKIPSTQKYTLFRQALSNLAGQISTVEKVSNSRSSSFRFDPKDFAAVRQALGSFSMSKAAIDKIREYFLKLAEFDLATEKENLKNYTTDAIGGFRPGVTLLIKQKQALAWMESRGNNGVCALDVGIGKTLSAIAMIKKLKRDGIDSEPDNNGRFLFVCDTSLIGNLPKEIHKFCEDPSEVLKVTDIITYRKFTQYRDRDPKYGEDYVAIFFDEAQKFKNVDSGVTQAAMSLKHSRKILLTASPMTRNPVEVFTLAAVSNNVNLNTPQGRKSLQEFKSRFCEIVGGRVVGIKNDPIILREFRVWVKRNLFYADKRDVEEVALPDLKSTTKTVTMDPRVEKRYREVTQKISDVLKALVIKYRDRAWDDPQAKRNDLEAFRIRFAAVLKTLNDLANTPETIESSLTPEERSQGPIVNPKVQECINIIDEQVDKGSRSLLHTDTPSFAGHVAPRLSQRFSMKIIAVCYPTEIVLYQNGKAYKTYRPKEYTDLDGKTYPAEEWKTYVLSRIICPDPNVIACILTATYAVGQNLQAFDTTINLDRDTWNAEVMKQRTGRCWRQGQSQSVKEYTLDAVYNEVEDQTDATLDEIRRWMQELEEDLFDSVVIESQTEALGKEIREMTWVSSYYTGLNRKLMELTMSPNPCRIGETEYEEAA